MIQTTEGKQIRNVAVLVGGWSHEINYSSSPTILRSLKNLGLVTTVIDITSPRLAEELIACAADMAFIATHGAYSEDGKLQGFLEIVGIPYTGPGVCASAVGMNKLVSKMTFSGMGLNVARFKYFQKEDRPDYSSLTAELGLPLVIKPIMAGASFGVHITSDENEFLEYFSGAMDEFGDLIVEEYLEGGQVEYSVGVLEDDVETIVLPICEIRTKTKFYSNESKNDLNLAEHNIPAKIDPSVAAEMQSIAEIVHRTLGCLGMSRTDMIRTQDGTIYVLEVNTLPGLLPASIFPDAAHHIGISYDAMIMRLVKSAFRRRPMEIPKKYNDFPVLPETNRPT